MTNATPPVGPVTICIPVYNEVTTIGAVLESVMNSSGAEIAEIMVCTNGTTDGTTAVVRAFEGRSTPVRLLDIPERGKARAWNRLVRESTTELLVFLDGDIFLPPETIAKLIAYLEHSTRLCAVSADSVPVRVGRNGDPFTAEPRRRTAPTGIAGCCYAIRKTDLLNRLAQYAYEGIPEDIIPEDRWLTLAIGDGRWAAVRGANVYYVIPDLRGRLAQMRRHYRGRVQLARDHACLLEQKDSRDGDIYSLISRIGRIRRECSRWDVFLQRLFRGVVFRFLRLVAIIQVRLEPKHVRLSRWDRAHSTKRIIRNDIDHRPGV